MDKEEEYATPKRESKDFQKLLQTPYIHTPRESKLGSVVGDELTRLKASYEDKCQELQELEEFTNLENFVILKEQANFAAIEAESRKLRMANEKLEQEVKEKANECEKAQSERAICESHMAGLEMQLIQLKEKMANRETELLSRIENGGEKSDQEAQKQPQSANEVPQVGEDDKLATLQLELDSMRETIELLQKTISTLEQDKKELRLIIDHVTSSEYRESTMKEAQKQPQSANDVPQMGEDDKLATLQLELDSMRETIELLQKTISTLEQDKKELSIIINHVTSSEHSELTMNSTLMDSTLMQEISLMEMDQTYLCELVGKSDSSASQQKPLAATIEALRQKNTYLVEENEKLSGEVFNSAQEVDDLKKKYECEISQEKNKNTQLQDSFQQLQTAHRAIEDALAEAEASISVLQREKDTLVDNQAMQQSEWSQHKMEFEKKINFYSDKSTRYAEEIVELNEKIGELVLKIEALEEISAAMQSDQNSKIELASELHHLKEKYAAAVKELEERSKNTTKSAEMEVLAFEVESLREKQSSDDTILRERENEIVDLQRQLDEQKNLIRDLEGKIRTTKFEEKSAKDIQEEFKAKIAALEEDLRKLATEKEKFEASAEKCKDTEDKVKFYSGKLSRCQEQIEKCNDQIANLIAENSNLKVTVEASRENAKTVWELRDQIAVYHDKQAELISEKTHLRNSLDEALKKCSLLENENSSLSVQIEVIKRDIGALKEKDLRDRDAKIGEMQRKLMLSESDVKKFASRVQELEAEERKTMRTMEEIQSSHRAHMTDLKGKLSNEVEEKRQLMEEKNKLDTLNYELTNVTKDLRLLLEGLKADLERSELDLQASREINKELQKEIDEIREKHRVEIQKIKTETSTEDSKYTIQIGKLREMLAAKNNAYEQLSADSKEMQHKLTNVQNENERNLNELESLRQKVTHTTDLVAEGERMKLQLELELEERVSEVEQLTEKLNAENTIALKDELQLYKRLSDDLKVELAVVKTKNDQSKNSDGKLAALMSEKDEIVKEAKALKLSNEKKIKHLKEANKNLADERDFLQNRLNVIHEKDKEIEGLKDRMRKKDKSIDKLTNLIKEKTVEISELRSKKTDRAGKEANGKETVQKEKRKSDRHSIYDGNRSIEFALEREVGTMTDPTSKMCQCEDLRNKVEHLKKDIIVLEYNLKSATQHNPLHNDLQILKLEMSKKELALSNMSRDMLHTQQELRKAEAQIKSLRTNARNPGGAAGTNLGVQTDLPDARFSSLDSGIILRAELEETQRNLKKMQDKCSLLKSECLIKEERIQELEGAVGQKENERQNHNEVQNEPQQELEMLQAKYNNLKRAFFKLRSKYDQGHECKGPN